jgi:hypothetical protein
VSDQAPLVAQLPDHALRTSTVVPPGAASAPAPCANCGQAPAPYAAPVADTPRATGFVYAVGRIRARFPSLGAEKEYAQLVGGDPDAIVRTADLKDTLSEEENRYLARQLCWVFSGPGGEAFAVVARDGDDLTELLDTSSDGDSTLHVVVGSPASPTVGAAACVASGLPAVSPDQMLVFTRDEFLAALPQPDEKDLKGKDLDAWKQTAGGLFDHLTQRAGNHGVSDEHRAMNYLALRYPQIYHLAFNQQAAGAALISVDARPATSNGRREVAVRFVFRDARTHVVQGYLCRVDVTDLFPFLTSPLTLTFD